MEHALAHLLVPRSIAVVGASDRASALGGKVYANVKAGAYRGALYPVNVRRDRVHGDSAWPTLTAIGQPVDLAVVAVPSSAALGVIADAGRARVPAMLMLTGAPDGDEDAAAAWTRDVAAAARAANVRLLGPRAYGIVRTDIDLAATFSGVHALPGRLAVVSQSGAMCTALLDFATPLDIGFSSVVAVGEAVDVDVGEILDALALDAGTDAILLYVEDVRDARVFLSSLRAAARMKPVVVLRAGRSEDRRPLPAAPAHDAVFGAALRRAGAVRVDTYTQLFAAARALASGRIPRGDRIAFVANGRGPALLAADRALDIGLALARFSPATEARLRHALPRAVKPANPLDVLGDGSARHYREAVQAVVADEGVDALIVLQVPRPIDTPAAMARAVAEAVRDAGKPVLAAWLGSVDRGAIKHEFDAARIANFYTPENAVEAIGYLAAYRHNQTQLLEVPGWQSESAPPDLATADAIRARYVGRGAVRLADPDADALLAAFGLVRRVPPAGPAIELALGVDRDPVFGPAITLAGGQRFPFARAATALPPLNARLAHDLVDASAFAAVPAAARDVLAGGLCALSTLVAALPFVRNLRLDPVFLGPDGMAIAAADIDVDADTAPATPAPGYTHMAIHPWPAELVGELVLRDGTRLPVRPIRPEDAEPERAFVAGLSPETRYYRFFYRFNALSPAMVARFTQVDYDRELALVALSPAAGEAHEPVFAGVARYIRNAERHGAEFAVVVGDAWQGRGLGRALMMRLIDAARERGIERFDGAVLRENAGMLRFVEALGFTLRDDPDDHAHVLASLQIRRRE
ncbi:MAG: GNAT family N-acetyltransferase [Proteobacteria bacterium]|nr:GNAT family N-acetyltransferase [Pseudomonadota bacterium]